MSSLKATVALCLGLSLLSKAADLDFRPADSFRNLEQTKALFSMASSTPRALGQPGWYALAKPVTVGREPIRFVELTAEGALLATDRLPNGRSYRIVQGPPSIDAIRAAKDVAALLKSLAIENIPEKAWSVSEQGQRDILKRGELSFPQAFTLRTAYLEEDSFMLTLIEYTGILAADGGVAGARSPAGGRIVLESLTVNAHHADLLVR